MNKHITTILAVALLLTTLSCNKTILKEDLKGSVSTHTFYKSAKDLEAAMGGVVLQFNGAFNQTWAHSYAGDDITSKNTGNKTGFSDIDVFNFNASNNRIINWWNYFYSTIKSANMLIQKYSETPDATDEQKNNTGGLAYFYRAASYFFLTRTWGEIPLNLDGVINNNRPNEKVEDIYTVIVADLQKAEAMLPNGWNGIRVQQNINLFPTKGTARALLANVYLTMAGWPLKQNDKYALAAQKAKEVIDSSDVYGYQLEDIHQLWRKRFTPETVLGCYYNIGASGGSWENGSQMGPQAFGCEEEGDWEDGYGELTFYKNFPAGPRKDETYQKEYWVERDKDGKPTKIVDYTGTNRKHPFFLKYRYDNFDWAKHKAIDWWGSATVPVIRYAEVLLTYAEAQAMSAGPDAKAYAAINQVRTRAGLPGLVQGLSKEAFRDSIIAERGWEFAGPEPAARWFDLLRTETLGKANALRDSAEIPILPENMPNDQTHKNYWVPIPISK